MSLTRAREKVEVVQITNVRRLNKINVLINDFAHWFIVRRRRVALERARCFGIL